MRCIKHIDVMMLSKANTIIHCYWRSLLRPLYSSTLKVRSLSSSAASAESSSSYREQILSYNRDTGIISDAQSMQPLYQTIIGVEIHAQLAIPTKLFSSAPTKHHANKASSSSSLSSLSSNTNVHAFDLGYPGTLPTLSHHAIQSSILSAASLNCQHIHRYSKFERKHYFYADLPHGYQITQQRWPLASEGVVEFLPHESGSNHHQLGGDGNDNKKKKKKKRRRGREGDNAQEEHNSNDESSSKQQQPIQPVQLRIERIQLEQDTGKTTTHNDATDNTTTTTTAHINYNRAGCALIEIVSYPDLRSAHEAAGVVEKIRKLLKHVGSCDGKMEEGSLRCDLNVSVAPVAIAANSSSSSCTNNNDNYNDEQSNDKYNLPPGNGHRVEVKNLNSLRQIIAATEYEAKRQSTLALRNEPTGRETRTFNPINGETICIRAKGDAVDYRFMPEPDLPPLILDETTLGGGCKSLEEFLERYMPESAEDATARLVKEYGLGESVAGLIASDPPAIGLFEGAVSVATAELEQQEGNNDDDDCNNDGVSVLIANFLCNDLYALIKKSAVEEAGDDEDKRASLLNSISVDQSTVDSQRLGLLVAMIANGTLTTSMAKKILTIMYNEDLTSSPRDIATRNGWEVISDMDVLLQLCTDVVHDPKNAKQLEQYKQGGKNTWKIEKFFVGKIMGQSNGNAHPEKMKEALAVVLEKLSDTSP